MQDTYSGKSTKHTNLVVGNLPSPQKMSAPKNKDTNSMKIADDLHSSVAGRLAALQPAKRF